MIKRTAVLFLVLCIGIFSFCACKNDRYAMTFEDTKLTEGMYRYLFASMKNYYLDTYSDIRDEDSYWSSQATQTQTYAEYIDEQINVIIQDFVISDAVFDALDYQVTEEAQEQILATLRETEQKFGGQDGLDSELSGMGLNSEDLLRVYTMQYKYEYLLYESGVSNVNEEALENYYQNKYSCVKAIYVNLAKEYRLDADGEKIIGSNGYYEMYDMSQSEISQKREKIASMEEQIARSPDSFEDLYAGGENELDIRYYPNGFYICADNLYYLGLNAVSDVAFELEVGECTTVYDDYGAYLVKRISLPEKAYEDDNDYIQFTEMEEYCKKYRFQEVMDAYLEYLSVNHEITDQYSVTNVRAVSY